MFGILYFNLSVEYRPSELWAWSKGRFRVMHQELNLLGKIVLIRLSIVRHLYIKNVLIHLYNDQIDEV